MFAETDILSVSERPSLSFHCDVGTRTTEEFCLPVFVKWMVAQYRGRLILDCALLYQLAADMQQFSRPDRKPNGPTVTHMWYQDNPQRILIDSREQIVL